MPALPCSQGVARARCQALARVRDTATRRVGALVLAVALVCTATAAGGFTAPTSSGAASTRSPRSTPPATRAPPRPRSSSSRRRRPPRPRGRSALGLDAAGLAAGRSRRPAAGDTRQAPGLARRVAGLARRAVPDRGLNAAASGRRRCPAKTPAAGPRVARAGCHPPPRKRFLTEQPGQKDDDEDEGENSTTDVHAPVTSESIWSGRCSPAPGTPKPRVHAVCDASVAGEAHLPVRLPGTSVVV